MVKFQKPESFVEINIKQLAKIYPLNEKTGEFSDNRAVIELALKNGLISEVSAVELRRLEPLQPQKKTHGF